MLKQAKRFFSVAKKRPTFSITSFFHYPEQGIHEYETLSRGTAFLVKTSPEVAEKTGIKYHVITTAHITHPFSFKHLYADEKYAWLDHIGPEQTQYKLELRDDQGSVLQQFTLSPNSFVHPTGKDVVILHLRNEKEFFRLFQGMGQEIHSYSLASVSHEALLQQTVQIPGYDLAEDETLKPFETKGIVSLFADHGRQIFVATPSVLRMGMCGAPVLVDDKCLGMIEGTYQKQEPSVLKDKAAFISTKELIPFIRHVEEEMVSKQQSLDDEW